MVTSYVTGPRNSTERRTHAVRASGQIVGQEFLDQLADAGAVAVRRYHGVFKYNPVSTFPDGSYNARTTGSMSSSPRNGEARNSWYLGLGPPPDDGKSRRHRRCAERQPGCSPLFSARRLRLNDQISRHSTGVCAVYAGVPFAADVEMNSAASPSGAWHCRRQ
jgi:hypothetical protein